MSIDLILYIIMLKKWLHNIGAQIFNITVLTFRRFKLFSSKERASKHGRKFNEAPTSRHYDSLLLYRNSL